MNSTPWQRYEVTAKLLEDAHLGSGAGNQSIDALIARNRKGQPVIWASQFEGILRDVAVSMFGYASDNVKRLFGTRGNQRQQAIFTSLHSNDAKESRIWRSTARVSYANRAPKDNTLRVVEFVPMGTSFRGEVEMPLDLEPVLRRLLREVDAVGHGRATGAGRVEWTLTALEPPNKIGLGAAKKRLLVLLRNVEPLCIAHTAIPDNIIPTLAFIPGRTVMGAFGVYDDAVREQGEFVMPPRSNNSNNPPPRAVIQILRNKPHAFVPLPNDFEALEPVWHDGSSSQGRLSGEVRFEMTTVSPLLVGWERKTLGDLGLPLPGVPLDKPTLSPLRAPWGERPVLIPGDSLKGLLRHELGALLEAPMERVAERSYSYRPNLQFPDDPNRRAYLEPRLARVKSSKKTTIENDEYSIPLVVHVLPLLSWNKQKYHTRNEPGKYRPGPLVEPYRGGIGGGQRIEPLHTRVTDDGTTERTKIRDLLDVEEKQPEHKDIGFGARRLKEEAHTDVWVKPYITGDGKLDDAHEPKDALVHRDVVKRVDEEIRIAMETSRATTICVVATGGITPITALTVNIVRMRAKTPAKVMLLDIPDAARSRGDHVDRAVVREKIVPTPHASFEARKVALDLIREGHLIAAWGAVKHLHEDASESNWTSVIELLYRWASSLTLDSCGCRIPMLTDKHPRAIDAAMRVEFALRAGDVPRAVHGTVALVEAAMWDHLLTRASPVPKKPTVYELNPPPDNKLVTDKPYDKKFAPFLRVKDGHKIEHRAPSYRRIINEYFPASKPTPKLSALEMSISEDIRHLRNDVAHGTPTPDQMAAAAEKMQDANLWSKQNGFLCQPLVRDTLHELKVSDPEKLCDTLI